MELRTWQNECINQAMMQYQNGQSHFLCLATPGAGKTLMASMLAKQLMDVKLIDLVICISPSVIVADDFRSELEEQLGKKLDGKLGALGSCLTYQSMLLETDLWTLFKQHRVLVIFDEIHHCAGSDFLNSNAWGQKIISEIQGNATYTLALTGTPWRSDCLPIALSYYINNETIRCDYRYGLSQAIKDNVCRTPSITIIDNDKITFTEPGSTSKYNSFNALLTESNCNYQSLIESESLIENMIMQADRKLMLLRTKDSKAGGLIVASSVSHAQMIKCILKRVLTEDASVVTYLEPNAVSLIKKFKLSESKWIISVGMISEGTNIPRLKVCCYLTRVKTELYFRQVLGRILRASGARGDKGYLYMPSEPTLSEYAERINEDIPSMNILGKHHGEHVNKLFSSRGITDINQIELLSDESFIRNGIAAVNNKVNISPSNLSQEYEKSLSMSGAFKNKNVSINKLTTLSLALP